MEEVLYLIYRLAAEVMREHYKIHHHLIVGLTEILLVVEVVSDLLEVVEVMTQIYPLAQKILLYSLKLWVEAYMASMYQVVQQLLNPKHSSYH